jgi:hypothetical protein
MYTCMKMEKGELWKLLRMGRIIKENDGVSEFN